MTARPTVPPPAHGGYGVLNPRSELAIPDQLRPWGEPGIADLHPGPLKQRSGRRKSENIVATAEIPIPEPSTLAMAGIGMVGLMAVARRRYGKRRA